jgi:Domain of unknown function (DUF3883)
VSLISPGAITAAAVVVDLLRDGPLRKEAIDLQTRKCGLRGGALPFSAACDLLVATRLVAAGARWELTASGQSALGLLQGGEEPTVPFARLLRSLVLSTGGARIALSGVGVIGPDMIEDQMGLAADILSTFEMTGELRREGDGWKLTPESRVLLTGPLFMGGSTGPDPGLLNEVGRRGENLSMRFERERTGLEPIQVSMLSAAYGFDILSCQGPSDASPIAIEAKATTGRGLTFVWSRHEALVANALRDRYLLLAWAEVDLAASADDDYGRLRELGYPVIVRDPAAVAGADFQRALEWVAQEGARWVADAFRWELPSAGSGAPDG